MPRVEGLRVGPSQDPQSDYGPLVTAQHRDKVKGYINMGIEEGATLAVDGREFSLQRYEDGFFFGASLFDNVTAGMQFYREEIFGIVLQVICAPNFEGAIALPTAMTPATVSPSTSATATPPANLPRGWGVCMVGVNVSISVPLAYYSFGGWKRSAFGDMNRQGMDGTRFYTKLKTDASRWPSGVKEGFDLFIPTMKSGLLSSATEGFISHGYRVSFGGIVGVFQHRLSVGLVFRLAFFAYKSMFWKQIA